MNWLLKSFALSFLAIIGSEGFSTSLFMTSRLKRQMTTTVVEAGVGQRLLEAALQSPLYEHFLVPQARRTMVQTARDNDIRWEASLEWISKEVLSEQEWENALKTAVDPDTQTPEYYKQAFHAYLKGGNLCWDAAWEQELAGLGCTVVDLGCGTGTSSRRLAKRFPHANAVIGVDLSPYFLAVGNFLLEHAASFSSLPSPSADSATSLSEPSPLLPPQTAAGAGVASAGVAVPVGDCKGVWVEALVCDERITFLHRDAAHTRLQAGSAGVVVLDLVVHELTPEATKAIFEEAFRLLDPEGELWVNEMDFDTDGFKNLRANPLLFSLIRSTEPYLDEYAEYQSSGKLVSDLVSCGFTSVRLGAATGRHFSLVATKGRVPAAAFTANATPTTDATTNKDAEPALHGVRAGGVVKDMRFDRATGRHLKEDTHLKTWQSKK